MSGHDRVLVRLDYGDDDFGSRFRELLATRTAFEVEVRGKALEDLAPLLCDGGVDLSRLLPCRSLALLRAALTLAEIDFRAVSAVVLGDRIRLAVADAPEIPTAEAPATFELAFSRTHLETLRDIQDEIHQACVLIGLEELSEINGLFHRVDRWDAWPTFLVAFASQGCGDYYAYDLRTNPPCVRYMDPDKSVNENLDDEDDSMTFASFEAWYDYLVRRG